MTGESNVTEKECGERQKGMFERLNGIDRRLSNIEGQIGFMKWITPISVAILAVVVTLSTSNNGGCHMAKRQAETRSQLKNLAAVDTVDEYAKLKVEISDRVRGFGIDYTFPATGCRNYELEADGTIWMQLSGQKRVATNRWTVIHWNMFRADCADGLWRKLEAIAGALNPKLPNLE